MTRATPKPRPTLKDVARLAKVSYATVSYVVNNNEHAQRLSAETRTAVLHAAGRLRYRPNPMGRALQRGYTNQATLLIVTWEMAVSHASTAMAISRAASARGLDLTIHLADTHEQAAAYLEAAMLDNSGGLFVLWDSPASANFNLRRLVAAGLPVISMLPGAPSGVSVVTADREEAGRHATRHLFDLGHRRIGVLSDSVKHIKTRSRKLAGYRHALTGAGLRYDKRLVEDVGESNFQGGYDAFRRLRQRCPDITALFCLYDATALGAMAAAADAGLRCPEDLSVIGFGDSPQGAYWRPGLTTFSLSCDAIAVKSIELMQELRTKPHPPVRTILIPENFIQRGSTARCARARCAPSLEYAGAQPTRTHSI